MLLVVLAVVLLLRSRPTVACGLLVDYLSLVGVRWLVKRLSLVNFGSAYLAVWAWKRSGTKYMLPLSSPTCSEGKTR